MDLSDSVVVIGFEGYLYLDIHKAHRVPGYLLTGSATATACFPFRPREREERATDLKLPSGCICSHLMLCPVMYGKEVIWEVIWEKRLFWEVILKMGCTRNAANWQMGLCFTNDTGVTPYHKRCKKARCDIKLNT